MVEVIKIILTYFERSHACTVALSAPNPAAGHHQPTCLLETFGHSWASLGQSLLGHCSFLLGAGVHKVLFVPCKCLVSSVCQGCMLSPCLFNLYAAYIMQNARLDEAQAGIKIVRKNINNFRYPDVPNLMAESDDSHVISA